MDPKMDVIGEGDEADHEGDESNLYGQTRGDMLGENKEEEEEAEPPKEEVIEAPKEEVTEEPKKAESPADGEEKAGLKSPVVSPPPGKAPPNMRS